MTTYYRFDEADGRLLSMLVTEDAAGRTDLTRDELPEPAPGMWPYRVGNAWVLKPEIPPDTTETVEQARDGVMRAINQAYTAEVLKLTSRYPQAERESWAQQVLEAELITSGAAAETPWIDNAAQERGITRQDLAERIIAKRTAYSVTSGRLSGIRQRLEDQVGAADTAAAARAISWPR